MGTKIIFYREAQRMTTPVLKFDGRELIPYHVEATAGGWRLFYAPGTTIPAHPNTWPDQLSKQGWRQVRCGVEPDGSVLVICERMAQP